MNQKIVLVSGCRTAVGEFLGELNPEEGYITVRPIAGMFDGAEENGDAD